MLFCSVLLVVVGCEFGSCVSREFFACISESSLDPIEMATGGAK